MWAVVLSLRTSLWAIFLLLVIFASLGEEAIVRCGRPSLLYRGRSWFDFQLASFAPGYNVTYQCNDPFVLLGSPVRTCGNDGRWHPPLPTCESVLVPRTFYLTPNPFGKYIGSVMDGDLATCVRTEEGTSNDKVHSWTGMFAQTNRIKAIKIAFPSQSFCTFQALVFSQLTKMETSCGQWRPTGNTLPLRVLEHEFLCPENASGDTVAVICHGEGHFLELCEVKVFQRQNQYSCPTVPDLPFHGTGVRKVMMQGPDRFYFQCDSSFVLDGTPVAYCQKDGLWSSETPFCKERWCPLPASPQNGQVNIEVSGSGVLPGGEAWFSCSLGFSLRPNTSVLQCLDDGHWSSDPPVCVENRCPTLPLPIGGWWSGDLLKENYSLGDSLSLRCKENFRLVGLPQIACLPTGIWSPQLGYCSDVKNASEGKVFKDSGFAGGVIAGAFLVICSLSIFVVICFCFRRRTLDPNNTIFYVSSSAGRHSWSHHAPDSRSIKKRGPPKLNLPPPPYSPPPPLTREIDPIYSQPYDGCLATAPDDAARHIYAEPLDSLEGAGSLPIMDDISLGSNDVFGRCSPGNKDASCSWNAGPFPPSPTVISNHNSSFRNTPSRKKRKEGLDFGENSKFNGPRHGDIDGDYFELPTKYIHPTNQMVQGKTWHAPGPSLSPSKKPPRRPRLTLKIETTPYIMEANSLYDSVPSTSSTQVSMIRNSVYSASSSSESNE